MTAETETLPAAPRRGPWLKRLVFAALVALNLLALFAFLQLRNTEAQFDQNVTTNDQVVPALAPTVADRSQPITFLLIGSDSREGLESLKNFGPSGGERADVIILLRIVPEDGTAQMLSIPRDTYVDIAGHGKNKINSAFAFGGAPLMVETVSNFTGIPINHYVEVDFVGFQAIVGELGGVEIDFPFPARDGKSGLDVDAGRQTLDGYQALAFARSRSYEELQDGSWVSVDANDFGRTRRQQQLIYAILRGLARPSSIVEMGTLVGGFAEYLTVDTTLAEGSLVQLAYTMRNVRPNQIEAATLPGDVATVDGASVVIPSDPEAGQILAALRAGEPMTAFDPTGLSVRVLNGNGVSGSAGSMADRLESDGFTIASVGDAERKDFATTTILVRPDTMAFGELIAGELGYGEVEIGTIGPDLGAVVIVGRDDTTASS
ncbi:MAG TPA: LCP family protein [Acidimicrobiia bacterium]